MVRDFSGGSQSMSERGARDTADKGGVTISFGERYLGSARFQAIYREGMELVEQTARSALNTRRNGARTSPSALGASSAADVTA